MKFMPLAAFAVLLLLLSVPNGVAADTNTAGAELNNLVAKINAKLVQGKKTEADLADDMKEFDTLLAKHKGEKTDDVASIQFMKALLYFQVLDNLDKGAELIKQLKLDFPGAKPTLNADGLLFEIEAAKARRSLVEGTKFPDFAEQDMAGKPLATANYKGKVVLVDFWSTRCPPCMAEIPNLLKIYQQRHAQGFEIIGISLDTREDQQRLASFLQDTKLPWQQYYDGMGWQSKLAVKYGVTGFPANYLLDGQGNIIAKYLMGEPLQQAIEKALPAMVVSTNQPPSATVVATKQNHLWIPYLFGAAVLGLALAIVGASRRTLPK